MSRSKWKGPYLNQTILQNKLYASRNSDILPKFVGLTFTVYDGKNLKNVEISKDMIGHKFGEFVNTRARYIFKKKRQQKKKKKK